MPFRHDPAPIPSPLLRADPTSNNNFNFDYSDLCNTLHLALPSQRDADILFGGGRSTIFVQALYSHYGELFHEGKIVSSTTLAVLPAVTAHPVLLARKLLQLALCVQQLDSLFDQSVLSLGCSPSTAMNKYHGLASSLVTCHEESLDSIEGLECLLYEGVYLVNCGNLRRALPCLRRASTLAQLMGMHRKVPYKSLKQLDPATSVSAPVIWAHITYLERYLSLLLGMPTAIPRFRFTSDCVSVGDTSTDWFEKKQMEIFERLIERNQDGDYDDIAITQKIDLDMTKMANTVPEKWWSMDLTQSTNQEELMLKMISAQLQIIHYNLLTVLHLPYLLRNGDDSRLDYSKTTCLYASREVLTRFIAFRSVVNIVFCCRPVDFCALTASLTLLLAYLTSHKRKPGWMLTHQRVGDRALIETAMETMDELNRINNDELSLKTAELTRKLLDLEAECARGGQTYNSSIQTDHDHTVGGEDYSIHLKVPYFGSIKLAYDLSSSPQFFDSASTSFNLPMSHYSTLSNAVHGSMVPHIGSQGDDTSQSSQSVQSVQSVQPPQHIHASNGQLSWQLNQPSFTFSWEDFSQFDTEMPDLMATAEDWAFQGVDSTFFDTLVNGNVIGQAIDNQNWDSYIFSR